MCLQCINSSTTNRSVITFLFIFVVLQLMVKLLAALSRDYVFWLASQAATQLRTWNTCKYLSHIHFCVLKGPLHIGSDSHIRLQRGPVLCHNYRRIDTVFVHIATHEDTLFGLSWSLRHKCYFYTEGAIYPDSICTLDFIIIKLNNIIETDLYLGIAGDTKV